MNRWFYSFFRLLSPGAKYPRVLQLIPIILCMLLSSACASNAAENQGALPASQSGNIEEAMTLEEALSTTLEDDRPQVLDQMGPPDVFKVTFQDLEGKRVRQEEWSYFDDQTRFDFINGTLLWTININSVPDMSLNASIYDPLSFSDGMSLDEVQSLLPDQELTPIDLADYGIPGGQAVAGDQILLGFEGGKLVSVQTFELEVQQ